MSFDPANTPNPYAAPTTDSNTPYSNTPYYEHGDPLATRMQRFAGAMIDTFSLLPILFGVGIVIGLTAHGAGMDVEGPGFEIVASLVGGLLGAVVFIAIHGYTLATRGQTLGKIVVKTQIVSENDDQILPFGEIILKRYVPLWVLTSIPFIGQFVGIANALAIFRDGNKCLHDNIAGTKVIKLPG